MATKQKASLLSLPRELRDIIYSHLYTSQIIDISTSGPIARNSSLLATNHQLRTEAAETYYKQTVFFIPFLCNAAEWTLKLPDEHVGLIVEMRHYADQASVVPSMYHALEFLIMKYWEEDGRVDWGDVLRMPWEGEDEFEDGVEDEERWGLGWYRLMELPREARELQEMIWW